MLPLAPGKVPELKVFVHAGEKTELEVELKISGKSGNFTPDRSLEKRTFSLMPGLNTLHLSFTVEIPEVCYGFICLFKNEKLKLAYSHIRITGILSVFNLINEAVSNYGRQIPVGDIGMDEFEFWCPKRRPEGFNLAMQISPGLDSFDGENIRNGLARPTTQPNAWVADLKDPEPAIRLDWEEAKTIRRIILKFDTDSDHPMESVLMAHPESVMPFCIRNFRIYDDQKNILYSKEKNYQTIQVIDLATPATTRQLTIAVEHPSAETPAAIFEILCYE
jgi:hypothetical protein